MKSCKHGHVDGSRHIPCYRCAAEYWETRADRLARECDYYHAESIKRKPSKALVGASRRVIRNCERYEWLRRGEGVMPYLGVTVCGKALDEACDRGITAEAKKIGKRKSK